MATIGRHSSSSLSSSSFYSSSHSTTVDTFNRSSFITTSSHHSSPSSFSGRDRFVVDTSTLNRELFTLRQSSSLSASAGLQCQQKESPYIGQSLLNGSQTGRLDHLYALHLQQQATNSESGPNAWRVLQEGPERILDAPGVIDDFYLNILDWSVRNVLAVALGPSVYLWNAVDSTVHELLTLPDSTAGSTSPPSQQSPYVASLSWMHDGKALAVGTANGLVQIWDVEQRRRLRAMRIGESGARVSALSWNRHLLSTGSRDGAVLTHDVRIAKHLLVRHRSRTSQEICGLSWCREGRTLACGSNDNTIHLWDHEAAEFSSPVHVLEGHRSAVKALSWCPWKGGLLASGGGSQDRTIRLWNTQLGECVEMADAGSQISSIHWSRHSRELVTSHGLERNHLALWKVNSSGRALTQVGHIPNAHDSRILHMTLSPDGRTIATAAADESIKFWSIFTARPKTIPTSHPSCSSEERKSYLPISTSTNVSSPFTLKTKAFR